MRRLLQWIEGVLPRRTVAPQSTSIATVGTSSSIAVYIRIQASDPLRQTEILTNVVQKRQSIRSLGGKTPVLEEIRHPYAIVITQDCDLEQDFKARNAESAKESTTDKSATDKLLPNILLLEAISTIELLGKVSGKDIRKRVRQNQDERYHVLQKIEPGEDAEGAGLPSLGVDFKRVFTVPTDELYAQLKSNAKRHSWLATPYLEHLAKRFANFQCRIALPKEHEIE